MKPIILIAGYTKLKYLDIIRNYFTHEEIILACAYTRPPKTDTKEKYLEKFDVLFNLNKQSDLKRLEQCISNVRLVTCTQERDMETYIKTLQLCNKITPDQAKLYEDLINKKSFKQELSKNHSELVPKVQIIDNALLKNLDSLSYPQVIKPSGLAGSILIRIVNSPAEFKTHYDKYADKMNEIGTECYEKNIDIITEEYLAGPQYSVNVYIDENNKVTFCPLVRVVTPQELGIDDSYSALQYTTDEISTKSLSDLHNAVQTVIKHFNIRETSAHFDSVLTNSGWKFFEVGLRIGGNRQEFYELSHSMNHFKNDILNRLNLPIKIPEQKNTVCIVQKAAVQSGTLNNISFTRKIIQDKPPLIRECKMAKIGKKVMPLKQGGGTIARHLVWGKDYEDVLDTAKEVFNTIKFDIR